MRESVATAPVDAALRGKECPLCTLHRDAEEALLDSFFHPGFRKLMMNMRLTAPLAPTCMATKGAAKQGVFEIQVHEMVMDGRCQQNLAKRGLCTHHAYLVVEAHEKLGAALALRNLVKASIHGSRILPPGCFLCDFLTETARQYAQVLGDFYAVGGESRARFESALDYFCLPHIDLLLAVNPPRWRAGLGAEFMSRCYRARKQNLERLEDELTWFIRKFDYRMAEESWRGTEDAVERAVRKLAGISGLPYKPGRSVRSKAPRISAETET